MSDKVIIYKQGVDGGVLVASPLGLRPAHLMVPFALGGVFFLLGVGFAVLMLFGKASPPRSPWLALFPLVIFGGCGLLCLLTSIHFAWCKTVISIGGDGKATEKEATKYIEYLKAENKILRSKLPRCIPVTPAEKATLLKLGERVGKAIKELISIVHPVTFSRWLREKKAGTDQQKRKRGRPRKPEELRQLVIDMAKGGEWGFKKIFGELKKLGIRCMSKSTVQRVLKEAGFDPGPKRGTGTWHEFVQRHIKTLWATDFFTKTVMTLKGPVTYYVLFFIHVHSRRVHLAGFTPNPDSKWMAQIARNMSAIFADEPKESRPTHIVRDRDTKFTAQFCSILESDGIEFRPIPALSPNLNPFAEAWVQRTKHEVLNHFIVFGEKHLRTILDQWLTYYHLRRPHQGLGNVPISGESAPEISIDDFRREDVVCQETLGGLLRHYQRKAA